MRNRLRNPRLQPHSRPLRVADFNNHFSSAGGGIRTYHLRKVQYFTDRDDVEYSLIVPAERDGIERQGQARMFELRAPQIPGNDAYRLFINPFKLKAILHQIRPDVIEVGGPYVDPFLMRIATRDLRVVVAGFWHTDYPTAYFEYYGNRFSLRLGRMLGRAGWALARSTYDRYDATFAAADCVIAQLRLNGIKRLIQCPLGADLDLFHPRRRDQALRRRFGAVDRPLLFFPHRLLAEKGVCELVDAVPEIAERTRSIFVFAGIGPEQARIERLVRSRADCHYLGYLRSPREMARWYASADLVFGLSAWETFGLSVVEALASGTPVIGADRGAVGDWIERSACGATVRHGKTSELIESTVRLLGRPDLQEMGRRGRRFAEHHFSWERTFERQIAYYRALVSARRAGRRLAGFPYLLERGAA